MAESKQYLQHFYVYNYTYQPLDDSADIASYSTISLSRILMLPWFVRVL